MKITVDGTTYLYEPTSLTMREAYRIKEQTGFGFNDWQQQIGEGDPMSIAALVFLLKQRAGEGVDWNTFDFGLASLDIVDETVNDDGVDALDPSRPPVPAGEPRSPRPSRSTT